MLPLVTYYLLKIAIPAVTRHFGLGLEYYSLAMQQYNNKVRSWYDSQYYGIHTFVLFILQDNKINISHLK